MTQPDRNAATTASRTNPSSQPTDQFEGRHVEGTRPEAGAGRRAFIKSFGCQMNVYDSQRMGDLLGAEGYGAARTAEEADLVVLNTCHIRERASEKIFSELGRLRQLKAERRREGRAFGVVVAGCVAQAEGAEILRRETAVDVVVGPQAYHRLPQLLAKVDAGVAGRERSVDTEFSGDDKFAAVPDARQLRAGVAARGPSAFLTVQEGCDKFCTFCVVPYTRGAELSRPVEAVLAEARRLLAAGVREITLLGQNVNGYHGLDGSGRALGLAALCRRLAALPGLLRLRYTTSHPNDLDDDLIAAHGELPALMPYLHLPVQSGSDRILKAMNRRHTAARFHDLAAKLRAARPDLALSSDFIVGFPGESERDFQDTLDLIAAVGFASSFSFKYSPRPGTPGADLDGQLPEPVKAERLARLQALLDRQRRLFNAEALGRTLPVLLERRGRRPGQLTGKTPHLQQVQLDGSEAEIGDVVPVLITALGANSLFGRRGDGEDGMRERLIA